MPEYHDIVPEYPEHLKEASTGIVDLTGMPIRTSIADIDQYPNEAYALMRRNGLGTSDSSIILGVNPFKDREALIEEKCRPFLSEEELAIGDKVAVRKGRDLEPLIIDKYQKVLGKRIFKPVDMYEFTDFPWLKLNFDGIVDKTIFKPGKFQYIPSEIKVVTYQGQKHYDKTKAWFSETTGFLPVPQNYAPSNNSIETKAAQYGIPPYYYTQLQQQILGCDAPFGYLAVLFDWTWELVVYMVWADPIVHTSLVVESQKVWTQILQRRTPDFNGKLEENIRIAIDRKAIETSATSVAPDISGSVEQGPSVNNAPWSRDNTNEQL